MQEEPLQGAAEEAPGGSLPKADDWTRGGRLPWYVVAAAKPSSLPDGALPCSSSSSSSSSSRQEGVDENQAPPAKRLRKEGSGSDGGVRVEKTEGATPPHLSSPPPALVCLALPPSE